MMSGGSLPTCPLLLEPTFGIWRHASSDSQDNAHFREKVQSHQKISCAQSCESNECLYGKELKQRIECPTVRWLTWVPPAFYGPGVSTPDTGRNFTYPGHQRRYSGRSVIGYGTRTKFPLIVVLLSDIIGWKCRCPQNKI